jgi:hypothetical protein
VEEVYTASTAHIRRPHPDWAARPAPMRRAAHAQEVFVVEGVHAQQGAREPHVQETLSLTGSVEFPMNPCLIL